MTTAVRGVTDSQDYAIALKLILLAVMVMRTARLPRPIAYLMALSGVIYLAQGGVVGSEGFSDTHSPLIIVAWILSIAWMIWLVVVAQRLDPESARRANQRVRTPATA